MPEFSDFDTTVKMRRDLKTKMGKCFHKGQLVKVRHRPEERNSEGFKILSEHWEAVHPIFESGRNPHVTVLIPLNWATKVSPTGY